LFSVTESRKSTSVTTGSPEIVVFALGVLGAETQVLSPSTDDGEDG
jgi:hypothetical protein